MFFFDSNDINIISFKPKSVEHGYLAVLNDDLDSAKAVFESVDSPRAKWGVSFTEILKGFIELFPSYFGIRNFMEIDLDFLIKNEKIDYAEQLLGSLELLAKINSEAYKYAARVMYENGFYKPAFEYMEKSKDLFYNDPELHFMYAKYSLRLGNISAADESLSKTLIIVPSYQPAIKLKRELSESFA